MPGPGRRWCSCAAAGTPPPCTCAPRSTAATRSCAGCGSCPARTSGPCSRSGPFQGGCRSGFRRDWSQGIVSCGLEGMALICWSSLSERRNGRLTVLASRVLDVPLGPLLNEDVLLATLLPTVSMVIAPILAHSRSFGTVLHPADV